MTYGWRARIGFITPSNTLETPAYEFYLMAPEGVTLVGACLSINRITPEALEAALRRVEAVAQEVAAYSVDLLVVGGGPLVYMAGKRGADRALGQRITAACGVPSISEITATIDAFRALGARRIAVATPFTKAVNERLANYLSEEGFEIASLVSLGMESNAEITLLPLRASYQAARDAWRQAGKADAIYIGCPRWAVAPNIEPLEQDLGAPVVGIVQSFLWAALRELGIGTPIANYGRLLRDIRFNVPRAGSATPGAVAT